MSETCYNAKPQFPKHAIPVSVHHRCIIWLIGDPETWQAQCYLLMTFDVLHYCCCMPVPHKGCKTSTIWGASYSDAAVIQCWMNQNNFQVCNHWSDQCNHAILDTKLQQRSLPVRAAVADATITPQKPQGTMPKQVRCMLVNWITLLEACTMSPHHSEGLVRKNLASRCFQSADLQMNNVLVMNHVADGRQIM